MVRPHWINQHPPACTCASCVARRREKATPPPRSPIGGKASVPRSQPFVYREPEIPHRGNEGEYGLYCLCDVPAYETGNRLLPVDKAFGSLTPRDYYFCSRRQTHHCPSSLFRVSAL